MNISKFNNIQAFKGIACATLNNQSPNENKVILQKFDDSLLDDFLNGDEFSFPNRFTIVVKP